MEKVDKVERAEKRGGRRDEGGESSEAKWKPSLRWREQRERAEIEMAGEKV